MSKLNQTEFSSFVKEIKAKVYAAQYEALKVVNKRLIQLYWDIGKSIVERQKKFGWGKSVVKELSKELQKEFPGISGFSSANLWRMRHFYLEYFENEKLAPMVREIGWTHNLIIFQKCKDNLEREFYLIMTKKYGWTKNILIHQIENKSYEKFLLNQTNFDQTVPEKYRLQAKLAVKDEYTFDFLELGDEHSEHELEINLVKNIRRFLIEMGGDFSFIGNQFRIKIGEKEYWIDLLLFHRRLKSLVAIDLKIGEFQPEFKGKMEFYLNALNDQIKLPDENDSIGIIICKSKDKTVVEYSLKNSNHPIGVATYTTTSKLPEKYKGLLPSPSEIEKSLRNLGFDDILQKE